MRSRSSKMKPRAMNQSMTTGWRSLLASTVLLALASLYGGAACAAEDDLVQVFSVKPADFVEAVTAKGTFLTATPMQIPGVGSGGIARFKKGKHQLRKWPLSSNEVFYVVAGKGRITVAVMPFDKPQVYDVGVGDFFAIKKGSEVSMEALSDSPFETFFFAPD